MTAFEGMDDRSNLIRLRATVFNELLASPTPISFTVPKFVVGLTFIMKVSMPEEALGWGTNVLLLCVAVGVRLPSPVGVGCVAVADGVSETEGLGVRVEVEVGVEVCVGVEEEVGVSVGVFVEVGVGVGGNSGWFTFSIA